MSKRIILTVFTVLLALGAADMAAAATPISLNQLLERVKAGRANDGQENAARLRQFQADRAKQADLVRQVKADQARQEDRSKALEATFDVNDQQLIELEQQLQDRLGSLKELFGVLQQSAGDALGQFENSITQVQFPERSQFLRDLVVKMGQSNRLASMDDIERLWFELQREMIESGKVVQFTTDVVTADGSEVNKPVTRVGVFNVISDGKFLEYVPETGRLVELVRQPQGRFLSRISEFEDINDGLGAFPVDPSRGQILGLLVEAPSLRERIDQGGIVGYLIIALGVIALLVALERIISLTLTSLKVRSQMNNIENPGNNPLGRVLSVYQEHKGKDLETLELKLGESILKETPKLNRMLMFLKIIAVVAPLMGLLGTVTGMIVTFQAITLFGTGDPKLMAGGISQALVTTVLGLCVAIPVVFMHTMVASRAKRLNQVLQEQAAGMIARQAEQLHRAA